MSDSELFDYYRKHEAFIIQQAKTRDLVPIGDVSGRRISVDWSERAKTNDDFCQTITGFPFLGVQALTTQGLHTLRTAFMRNGRKGRRIEYMNEVDRVMLVLCHLKHYEPIDVLGKSAGLNKVKTWRILMPTLDVLASTFYNKHVQNQRAMGATIELPIFQQIQIPSGTNAVRSPYYSTQQKQYGLVTRAVFDVTTGYLLSCSPSEPAGLALNDDEEEEDPVPAPVKQWITLFRERHYVMTAVYRADIGKMYDKYFHICAALTNNFLGFGPGEEEEEIFQEEEGQ